MLVFPNSLFHLTFWKSVSVSKSFGKSFEKSSVFGSETNKYKKGIKMENRNR